jgi:hypothetical protein
MIPDHTIRQWLRGVKFDDWQFTLAMLPEGRTLVIRMLDQDNYQPDGPPKWFSFRFPVPPLVTKSQLIAFAMSKVEKIVLHEAQEKFLVSGERYFDPHREHKGLWVDTSRLA